MGENNTKDCRNRRWKYLQDDESMAAIEIVGDHYRVLTSTPDAKAYKLFKRNGRVVVVELRQDSEYTPLVNLLKRQ